MASFFLLVGQDGILKTSQVNLGGTSAFSGVYFDGLFFWFLQDKDLKQVWFNEFWVGTVIRTIDLSNIIGNAGTSTPTGITGDRLNLYIAFGFGEGEPATFRSRILLLDKNGVKLKEFSSTTQQTPTSDYTDLTYDGLKIYAGFNDGGLPIQNKIGELDIQNNVFTEVNVGSSNTGIEFNGRHFFYGTSTDIRIRDRNYTDVKTIGTLARASRGMTMVGLDVASVA